MLAPRGGRALRRRRRAGGRAAPPRASRSTGPRRSSGGQYLIRFGTEGRSEGRRLGYLCLQQQHVEVGDRLSVDAQELQFTSQSVCQLSDLKLPGRKGKSQEPRSGGVTRLLRPLQPRGSRTSRGLSAVLRHGWVRKSPWNRRWPPPPSSPLPPTPPGMGSARGGPSGRAPFCVVAPSSKPANGSVRSGFGVTHGRATATAQNVQSKSFNCFPKEMGRDVSAAFANRHFPGN